MPEENVEIIGRCYDCLARRDWDAMWRDFDPDFVLDTELQGSFRGRDACQAFIEDQISAFESSTAEPVEVFEGGEYVAVFVRIRARPKTKQRGDRGTHRSSLHPAGRPHRQAADVPPA